MPDARHTLASLPDQELESRLLRLGEQIAWPDAPDFDLPSSVTAPPPQPMTRRRTWLLAAAAVAIAFAAAFAAFDGLRDGVAGIFGVRGIHIDIRRDGDPTPTPATLDPLSESVLGSPVTLAEATASLPFPPQFPAEAGEPAGLAMRTLPGGEPMLSAIYAPSETLPETAETGAGLLLMQFQSEFEVPQMLKSVTVDFADVVEVSIDGETGFWVEGATWLTILDDPSAGESDGVTRPSANVLIWQSDGVTYRMESALDRDTAVSLAQNMQSPNA